MTADEARHSLIDSAGFSTCALWQEYGKHSGWVIEGEIFGVLIRVKRARLAAAVWIASAAGEAVRKKCLALRGASL